MCILGNKETSSENEIREEIFRVYARIKQNSAADSDIKFIEFCRRKYPDIARDVANKIELADLKHKLNDILAFACLKKPDNNTILNIKNLKSQIANFTLLKGLEAGKDDIFDNDSGDLTLGKVLDLDGEKLYSVRVQGDSMVRAGIITGDLLIFRKPEKVPPPGSIILAKVQGMLFVKRLIVAGSNVLLFSENPEYEPFIISYDEDFRIVGEVIAVIKSVGPDLTSAEDIELKYDNYSGEAMQFQEMKYRTLNAAERIENLTAENIIKYPDIYFQE